MPADYAERAVMAQLLMKQPRCWNNLNDRNKLAANKFMEQLLEWQEKRQYGKILTHVNTDGVAHKIEPTLTIVIKQ